MADPERVAEIARRHNLRDTNGAARDAIMALGHADTAKK
jgi:hypothetical protein